MHDMGLSPFGFAQIASEGLQLFPTDTPQLFRAISSMLVLRVAWFVFSVLAKPKAVSSFTFHTFLLAWFLQKPVTLSGLNHAVMSFPFLYLKGNVIRLKRLPKMQFVKVMHRGKKHILERNWLRVLTFTSNFLSRMTNYFRLYRTFKPIIIRPNL